MKFIGRVSLFCIIGILGFILGIYAKNVFMDFFYPNYENVKHEQNDSPITYPVGNPQEEVISCDTRFIIEEYNKITESITQHEEDIPGKYIGMNRTDFLDAIYAYEQSPPLAENQKGLVSVEVLSFSDERVLLRKNYELIEIEKEPVFYLVADDHYISVYKEDMQSVFLYTDICLEDLPMQLQEEIIMKKLICGENNLYHFLESYSS